MNNAYYSELDKIILRSKRRRMARKCFQNAKDVFKYLFCCTAIYGTFYFVWSLLCYVFPEIP